MQAVSINLYYCLSNLCQHLLVQIFRDSNPFGDEVESSQECCAKVILEHIEASVDNDMN
jgi:hypothetical protein